MSVILRTAGIDRSPEELAWDLENLLTIWHALLNIVLERKSPFLIYRESNSVVRALRDYFTNDIGEILIDDETTYKEALEFVEQVMPQNVKKLKHYVDPVPLFTRYQIESQIESAFTHSETLPAGGSISIDHTEAQVSIDINSARATKGSDIEATALNTNLEAADEVERQLRIRDLGGLIVIDFIDMGPQKNQRDVENRLREAVRQDRARVQIGKISRFGLLEMSRQTLRPSLGESNSLTCPLGAGIGTIRRVRSLALAILRIIGEEARKERTAKVIAQLPVEVATYLLNEKRDWVQNLESHNEIQVVLVANPSLETPHYDVRRIRDDQTDLPENAGASYELADANAEPESPQAILERKAVEPAAIAVMKPTTAAPRRKKAGKGFWAWLGGLFSGSDEKKKQQSHQRRKQSSRDNRSRGGQRSRGRSDHKRTDDNRNQNRKRSKKTVSKKAGGAKDQNRQKDQKRQKKDGSKQQQQPKEATQEKRNDAQGGERKPARARRSRGGRRRRRSGGGSVQDRSTEQNPMDQASTEQVSQEQFAREQMSKESSIEKPVQDKPVVEVVKSEQPAKSGPPKVRTDAERAADAASTQPELTQTMPTMPEPVAPSESPKTTDKEELKQVDRSDTSGNNSPPAKPESKVKSEPGPKPKPKPKPKPEPKPEPEPKPKPEP